MIKLYSYFGMVGLLSLAAWMSAVVLLAAYARRDLRNKVYLMALALAVAGWVLGQLNSMQIREIQVDRTREYEEARLEQQRKRLDMIRAGNTSNKVTGVRFTEDTAGEQHDLSGLTTNEVAFVTQDDPSTNIPAYRLAGKQTRDPSKRESVKGSIGELMKREEPAVRTMPESDVRAANRLDRLNLGMGRLVVWLALGLVVWDYLRRFNRTTEFYFPLPLSGAWLDEISPKVHTAIMDGAEAAAVRRYLEGLARRGETFVYFGAENPLGSEKALSRLPCDRWPWMKLPVIHYGEPTTPQDAGFFFDGVWFNRFAVTVGSQEAAERLMGAFLKYLYDRVVVRASARSVVNFVWQFERLPDADTVRSLASLVKQTNFRFIHIRKAVISNQ